MIGQPEEPIGGVTSEQICYWQGTIFFLPRQTPFLALLYLLQCRGSKKPVSFGPSMARLTVPCFGCHSVGRRPVQGSNHSPLV